MTSSNAGDLLGPGTSNLHGLRILVVEDSWQVGAALKRLLEACGAEVVGPAATTAHATHLSSGRAIDVALVDINLRGGELAYALIDQLHDLGIRVVVLTGYDDIPLKHEIVDAVMRKPVPTQELLRILRPG
jgi:DNA-binding NarL/FixJ family response regulator